MFEDYITIMFLITCSSISSNTWHAHGQLSKLSITLKIISCNEGNQSQLDEKIWTENIHREIITERRLKRTLINNIENIPYDANLG